MPWRPSRSPATPCSAADCLAGIQSEAHVMSDKEPPTGNADREPPAVIVVGSLHYDIMVDAPDRPRKGETLQGRSWTPKFGGKGGNQAAAARRQGVSTAMV